MALVILIGYYLAMVLSGFVIYGAATTAVYYPVFKKYGVKEKLIKRSLIMGAISAGAFLGTILVGGFLFGGFTLLVAVGVSTVVAGNYLRKKMFIEPRDAYLSAFGVAMADLLVWVALVFIIFVFR